MRNHPLSNRRLALALVLFSSALPACRTNPSVGVPADAPRPGPAAAPPAPVPTLQVAARATDPTTSSVADLVEHVAPMVVNITTTQTQAARERAPHPFDFFFPEAPHPRMPRQRSGAGTGFVIDGTSGYIVTNAHVVADADEVKVHFLDSHELSAEVVGKDTKVDLALLKVNSPTPLPSAVLGDSAAVRVGEQVLAVGNPFGLGHSVSLGIVSAKARTIGAGPYDDFIQTDASINPGNSGGPLFNLRGEVIGINTAIRADANSIGFAIPVDVLKDVVVQLREKGFVERGKLGLAFQPMTPELAAALGLPRPQGAIVNEVAKGSAAARAGIEAGDVIVEVEGTEIHRSEDLARNVARHAPGSTVTVKVLRQGKPIALRATLDKLEEEERHPARRTRSSGEKTNRMLGLEVGDDPDGGVRVVDLAKPIDGLRPGDVIVEVAGKPVGNVEGLRSQLEGRKEGETVLIKVKRGARLFFVGLPVG
ncbi:MAG: Do family serine endopeptidase [Deltaproteobacteria bacterium]|nr:Do family serine endopeptidase [Deltaproteobacteria bacterium]